MCVCVCFSVCLREVFEGLREQNVLDASRSKSLDSAPTKDFSQRDKPALPFLEEQEKKRLCAIH